jgi:hypothetical protein
VYYPGQDILLIGIPAHSRKNFGPKQGALRTAIGVCLVLLVVLAAVHMAIGHSADADADHCQLCVVMHSVAPLLIMTVAVLLVRIEIGIAVMPEIRAIVRYWHPILFTRPPPISC